jgi:glycosyltransferase involved in cell wall biosynthesis
VSALPTAFNVPNGGVYCNRGSDNAASRSSANLWQSGRRELVPSYGQKSVNGMPNHGPSSETIPLAAIVTPVHNGEAYLAETMDSVQAQDYPNLIHIVLDNASTDATPSILERYTAAKVPVSIFRNATLLPLAKNWNAAVALIPGDVKYFRILCADDLIMPTFMSRVIDVAERNPRVGVVGTLLHENDGPTIYSGWPPDREVISGQEAIGLYFRRQCWLPSLHAVYRCCEIVPGRSFFDEDLVANDLAASLRVLTRFDLGIVPADLAMTRLHADSVTTRVLDGEKRHFYEWLVLLQRYASEGLGERAAKAYLVSYRRRYLRQLVKWRFGGRRDLFTLHLRSLASLGMAPTFGHFVDALLDWALVRVGRREGWSGYPFDIVRDR